MKHALLKMRTPARILMLGVIQLLNFYHNARYVRQIIYCHLSVIMSSISCKYEIIKFVRSVIFQNQNLDHAEFGGERKTKAQFTGGL